MWVNRAMDTTLLPEIQEMGLLCEIERNATIREGGTVTTHSRNQPPQRHEKGHCHEVSLC